MKQASVGQRHFTGQEAAEDVRYHNGTPHPLQPTAKDGQLTLAS